jgi:hypothetical protein
MKQQARVVTFIISLVVFLLVASCRELYPQALTWPEVDCGRPSLNSLETLVCAEPCRLVSLPAL